MWFTNKSSITWLIGSPVSDVVNPVTSPGPPDAMAVKSNVTTPSVNVLGLCSCIAICVLSHTV